MKARSSSAFEPKRWWSALALRPTWSASAAKLKPV
jgi:hypothetical protein